MIEEVNTNIPQSMTNNPLYYVGVKCYDSSKYILTNKF